MNPILKAVTAGVGMLCLSAALLAQSFSLSLKDVTVKKAMAELQGKSGYTFVYSTDDIDAGKIVSVNATSLQDAVTQILAGQDVSWSLEGQTIVLSSRHPANPPIRDNSRQGSVSGTVLDSDGQPVIGVAVKVRDAQTAVMADIDGRYSIAAAEGAVLEFRCLGYRDLDVRVGRSSRLDVTMLEDISVLDEAVVMGYGTTTRKNLTTAIATVKTENISKAANSNLNNLLLGRAAGLQATIDSPQPGGSIDISIRGGGTPVYVVDGVVMPSSSLEVGVGSSMLPTSNYRAGLGGINPADIESIEILKDASAAIYGIDAANGVILITTKKGSAGKIHVDYEGSVSLQKSYPYLKMVSGPDMLRLLNVFNKESYLLEGGYYPYGNTTYAGGWTPLFTDDYIDSVPDTDWMDLVLKNGYITNHSLSVNGGNDRVSWLMSVNYYDETSIVRNSDMQRIILRTNVQAKITDWMRLTSILNVNNNSFTNSTVGADQGNGQNKRAGVLYDATVYPTYLPVKDEDGNYTIFNQTPNPLQVESIDDKTKQSGVYANFALDVDIVKGWLSTKGIYGVNRENTKRDAYIPEGVYYALRTDSRGVYGWADRSNQTLEGTVTFQHSFWDKALDVSAVAGMGVYFNDGESLNVTYENANDHIRATNLASADGPFYHESGKSKNEKRSQFARVTFNGLDRYILSATIRRDGTDKFFEDKKYAWFPSVSAAWKIADEPWLKDAGWLNMLKLRASIGTTGSDNLGTTLYGVIKNSKQYVTFDSNSTVYVPYAKDGINYTDVTWQKTVMKNVGVDFSLFRDKLWGSADVFRNDITHLLGTDFTDLLDFNTKRPVNYGHYYRAGFEFELNSQIVKTRDTELNLNGTLSRYNAVWVSRQDNYAYKAYQKRHNEPVNANYYYKWDGLVNTDKTNIPDSQRALGKYACMPGFPIIKDKNGDGEITVDDAYMDNNVPDFYFGLGASLSWRNWDFAVSTYGQVGVEKTNVAISRSASTGNLLNGLTATSFGKYAYQVYNSQTAQDGKYPGIAFTKTVTLPAGLGVNYTRQDASFLRVRNITLGYTFGSKSLRSLSKVVKSLRVYADLQNPVTFTKFTVYDPEISISRNHLTGGQYPISRVYSAGVKLNFQTK